MSSRHFIIIIGIISYCRLLMLSPPTDAQKISLVDSRREEVLVQGKRRLNPTPAGDGETSVVSTHLKKSRKRRPQRPLQHRLSHIVTVHGIINVIGWGILIPSGAITARYFKTNNSHDHDDDHDHDERRRRFYSIHVVSQMSGFILGSIGWGLGLLIGRQQRRNSSMSLHGILGTIIFCLSVVQVTLGLRLMAVIHGVTELMNKKLWRICHGVVGYVLIVLIIANIFEGINVMENHSLPSKNWNWCYGVILGAFSFVALGLEVFRWIRFQGIDFI